MREGDHPADRERGSAEGKPDEAENGGADEPKNGSPAEVENGSAGEVENRGAGEIEYWGLDAGEHESRGEQLYGFEDDELDGFEDDELVELEDWDPQECADEEPLAPAVWVVREGRHVGVALRSGRRRLGWNQRQLAKRAGLNQATIARLEAGADARFSVVVRALWACGLELVAAPPAGAPTDWRVAPHPMDEGRDTAGRRLPAHLPAYPTEHLPTYTMWKRMLRGEDLIAARAPHWLYAREPWPAAPTKDEADRDQ